MAQDCCDVVAPRQRHGLLRDQIQLTKRKDCDRYEIVRISEPLSFDKGFFAIVRACQLLAENNDGMVFVGVAGPSGAGKSFLSQKVQCFTQGVLISMDHYNDASRIIDDNFDDPRLIDYDTLLENIQDLRDRKQVQVPIYDFKKSCRTGYRTVEVPSTRIVIIEGIYALSERLQPLLDLSVSVTGGVHFDLVKRVMRDIQRAGQEPEEIIHQISETVYPMYKAFIEPDLKTAHIKIVNSFNPFTGFQNPMFILKSSKIVSEQQIRNLIAQDHKESKEETYDIYLLPPGEDPEACHSYLRMRNREGKYNLMFEEWFIDNEFIISPRISFEVSVRLLGGLMALGYTIAAILKRNSHVFSDDNVTVKIDWLEQLNRSYIQVQGRERPCVKYVAEQLGLGDSYIPRTYIEQIQLEKLVNEIMALPDDLKTKFNIDDELASTPKEALLRVSADRRNKLLRSGLSRSYSAQGEKNIFMLSELACTNGTLDGGRNTNSSVHPDAITQLSEQMSTLNERMDEFNYQIDELNSKLLVEKSPKDHQNLFVPGEQCNGSAPTNMFVANLSNGTLTPHLSPSFQGHKDSPLMEELMNISRGQRQIAHQLENLSRLVHEQLLPARQSNSPNQLLDDLRSSPLALTLAVGGIGFLILKSLSRNSN